MNNMSLRKNEFGDWQTNYSLAVSICKHLKSQGINPQIVIEPTCGIGNFVIAATEVFDNLERVYCIEINHDYTEELSRRLRNTHLHGIDVSVINDSIFNVNMSEIKGQIHGKEILVLGNPPWVTNSKLGSMGSSNVPNKSNFKQKKGMDAITGKSNFDIAEYILYQMIELIEYEKGWLSFILKNSVIKNLIYEQKRRHFKIKDIRQYNINTQIEFNVSVAGSILTLQSGEECECQCRTYDFYGKVFLKTYGWTGNHFVADCNKYSRVMDIDGYSQVKWWSGLKHDCTKVMELTKEGDNTYRNSLGEFVHIEDEMVFPLLKSSDIKEKYISKCRKYVIVTQRHTSDDTAYIKNKYPLTFNYLDEHVSFFSNRKSIIYRNRPAFCIFGIGDYSFKKYKIAISGLYKQTCFSLVSDIDGKTVMVDDTAYITGFDNKFLAETTLKILNSNIVQEFVNALLFEDAKRPINKDLLMRIDLLKALDMLDKKSLDITDKECVIYRNKISQQLELQLPLQF